MPLEIQSDKENDSISRENSENPIFESNEDMAKSVTHLCYGNLYVIGNIWVQLLRSVLVGTKICLVPRVHAAKKKQDEEPKKPEKMPYKELPLYEEPHREYKDHLEDKEKCPECKEKQLHNKIQPTVTKYREKTQKTAGEVKDFAKGAYDEISTDLVKKKNDLKAYMRDPDKREYTKWLVPLGAATGFYFGSRKKGYLYRRTFFAGLGALAAGWLCFPKETDETVRNVSHEVASRVLQLYNMFCNKGFALRTQGPCESWKPEEPPPRKVDKKHQCPPPPKKK